MKSIYKYILGLLVVGLLVVGVLVMPFVVKNEVNKHIDSAKQSLNSNGVELTIVSEKGYISSTREIELKVTNGPLFRDYIVTNLTIDNPAYKALLRLIKKGTNKDAKQALKGITFKGTIRNSNLLLNKPVIELSLVKLSDKITSLVKENKKVSDIIFPMLAEKMITVYVTLDSNQNISQIIMKDINKNIKIDGKNINFQLVNNKLKLDVADNLIANYTIGKQSIKSEDFYIFTNGLSYKFEYLNKFNKSDSLHIDSFETKNDRFTLKIGNSDLSSNMADTDKKTLNINSACDIKDINFNRNGKSKLKLKKFAYTVNLSGLDRKWIDKASNSYKIRIFERTRVTQDTADALGKILNTGFKLNVKALLTSLTFMGVHLDKVDFLLNAELKENTYDVNDLGMINALLLNGSITMNKESLKELVSLNLNGSLEKFSKLAKKDGDKRIFNYSVKNGKIFLNGTKL